MTSPMNTYDSNADLSLGHVPAEIEELDQILYVELLDLHNAIESLLTYVELFLAQQRGFILVNADYLVKITDGLILVDTTAGDITITMYPASEGIGYSHQVKQIIGDNETLVIGSLVGVAVEPIDDDVGGITLDLLEAIPLKNDGFKWWIHN